jgi:hypothetical protein
MPDGQRPVIFTLFAEAARGARTLFVGILICWLPRSTWHVRLGADPTKFVAMSAVLTTVAGMFAVLWTSLHNFPAIRPGAAFTTGVGWLGLYLAATGIFRAACHIAGDDHGDPLLSVAYRFTTSEMRRHGAYRRGRADALARGARVHDRIVTGDEVGLPQVDVVIVASWPHADVRVGCTIVLEGRWYRLVSVEERVLEGRLRTLYGLTVHVDSDVARFVVRYNAPHQYSPVLRARNSK